MGQVTEAVKAEGKSVSIMGWVYLIFGIIAIILPQFAGLGITLAIGIALMIAGIGGTMHGWAYRKLDGWAPIIMGVLTAIAGALFLFRPWFGMKVLTLMLIIWFGATGFMRILAAFQLKPAKGWGWVLFDGIVSFVLGAWLWMEFPQPALWLLGLLFGVKLIFFGLVLIMTGKTVQDVADLAKERVEEVADALEEAAGQETGNGDDDAKPDAPSA